MRRELPSGLSARQRLALSEFFAGHLSAGQLSERLSLAGTARERVPTGSTYPGGGSGKPSPALRRRRRLAVALGAASTALADFPYTGPSGNPHDPTTWKLPPGVAPSNFADNWKLAATPEQSPQSDASVNSRSDELCGVRGMSVVDQNATFPGGSCIPAGS